MTGSLTGMQREMAGIVKRRQRKERAGRDLAADGETAVTTGAHDQAEGYRDAMADDAAAKGYAERGAFEGPGHYERPGHAEPEQYDRSYIEAGHAAESPQAEPPRENPIVHARPGIMQPIALPGAPMAARISPHVAAAYSMGSPSERAR